MLYRDPEASLLRLTHKELENTLGLYLTLNILTSYLASTVLNLIFEMQGADLQIILKRRIAWNKFTSGSHEGRIRKGFWLLFYLFFPPMRSQRRV